jgi:hypothetical protein
MSKFYKDLKAGLEEILAYKEGKIKLRSTYIEIPEPPASYKAKDIKKIREKKHYSQSIFAKSSMLAKKQFNPGNLVNEYQAVLHYDYLKLWIKDNFFLNLLKNRTPNDRGFFLHFDRLWNILIIFHIKFDCCGYWFSNQFHRLIH